MQAMKLNNKAINSLFRILPGQPIKMTRYNNFICEELYVSISLRCKISLISLFWISRLPDFLMLRQNVNVNDYHGNHKI